MKRAHAIPMTSGDEYDALTMGGAVAPEPVQTEQEKLEFQIGFYGLADVARRDEISAIEAADLIAIGYYDVANLDGKATRVPLENNDANRKKILLLILRRGESEQTKHPLYVWLSRASAKKIRYMTVLDDVVRREATQQFREFETVQHDESPPESPSDQALEDALKALDLAVKNKPAHSEKTSDTEKQKNRTGRPPVARDAANKAKDEAQKLFAKFGNKGHWTAIRIMARRDFVEAVFGADAVPFAEKELNVLTRAQNYPVS